MGSLVKYYLGQKLNVPPDQIYHVTLMPCFDKASRLPTILFFKYSYIQY
jgi:iron only hydrogenase large subunit-like protein